MGINELAQEYAARFKTLKADWYYGGQRGLAVAKTIEDAVAARKGLRQIAFADIAGLEDRRSFWINLYNGAVIDLAIACGVEHSVREVRGFFTAKRLELAGEPLSLDDIEHGFLRTDRRHPIGLLPPLLLRPRLRPWMVCPFDPRIHFALNCGGQSCPPIRSYANALIDQQLALATTAFLDTEVEIDPEHSTIRANRILRWYRSDFAGLGGLEEMIRRYRTGGIEARRWRFTWKRYDWSI
ncbi:MAG: DUF547 domain-containing protein [Candidatus Latescibacteria bacterium]|nr:DUF547 domain-containing protein [Candidatus Latescibacterota bacterium]